MIGRDPPRPGPAELGNLHDGGTGMSAALIGPYPYPGDCYVVTQEPGAVLVGITTDRGSAERLAQWVRDDEAVEVRVAEVHGVLSLTSG